MQKHQRQKEKKKDSPRSIDSRRNLMTLWIPPLNHNSIPLLQPSIHLMTYHRQLIFLKRANTRKANIPQLPFHCAFLIWRSGSRRRLPNRHRSSTIAFPLRDLRYRKEERSIWKTWKSEVSMDVLHIFRNSRRRMNEET
jgi:hypothetical protein